jgi:hypothetical protein
VSDAELESIRVRSEGALELVVDATVQLDSLSSSVSSDKWRDALPALSELASLLPEVRAAHAQLDAMRSKEGWHKDSRASKAVTAFEHGLYSLETAVAVQLKGLAIDHGAPRLEDAIAQLVARSTVVPNRQTQESSDADLSWLALLGPLAIALVLLFFDLLHWGNVAAILGLYLLIHVPRALVAMASGCRGCGGPVAPLDAILQRRCAHCGFRPR